MASPVILFFNEQSSYIIKRKTVIRSILSSVCVDENKPLKGLNIVFCDDNYLFKLNKTYLNHHTFTDVITFSYSDNIDEVMGDIFISVERAQENSRLLKVGLASEVNRLMIHGLLHLCGHNDKTELQKLNMRKIEDKYLSLLADSGTKNR
ncbi:MAG: rRNA maturation RNase YbeY [Bacteroidetes bacterium]|nr:rRNA maturation RNase YbeY [Bacteroidota bacterium]